MGFEERALLLAGNERFVSLVGELYALDYRLDDERVFLNIGSREEVFYLRGEIEKISGCKVLGVFQSSGSGYKHIVLKMEGGMLVVIDGSREFHNAEYGGVVVKRIGDMEFLRLER